MPIQTKIRCYNASGEMVESATCDGCGVNVQVDPFGHQGNEPLRDDWSNLLVENGVILSLSGGYNGWFDGPRVRALLCGDCTNKLVETFPALNTLIKSY